LKVTAIASNTESFWGSMIFNDLLVIPGFESGAPPIMAMPMFMADPPPTVPFAEFIPIDSPTQCCSGLA
jgi:hypothetical protein